MPIVNKIIELETEPGITITNVTPHLTTVLAETGIQNGQILVFSRHTTTAVAINENEERLLEDLKTYLAKLAPDSLPYLHNDLHLRVVPEDEPMNAHSHLMAVTLNNSEIVPIVEGKLGLGTWQSVLFFDLDGPRRRTLLLQITGETH